MAMQCNIGEAKTRLSELVAASLRGEDVMLAKSGRPVARIVALDNAKTEHREARALQIVRWIGSLKDVFPPNAADIFDELDYTDAELDLFEAKIGR